MSNPSARPAFTPARARRLGQRGLLLLASLALLGAALAVGRPAPAQANTAQANTAQALVSTPTAATVPPGTNLLANADATAGDTSPQGWDAVTIPSWQTGSGLPTVVRYGTPGFPKAAQPPKDPGNLFVGGAGGTATLVQTAPVIPADPSASAVTYTIEAWLGGTKTSAATLTVRFRNARGAVVATRAIGPLGRQQRPLLQRRTATGALPKNAVTAQVTLTLATTLTNIDGPYAPLVGYDYASAGGLGLTLSAPAQAPAPLTPPTPRVPGYQHVFLFYFENEDYGDIIGNVKQAPYLNSLRKDGATLSGFYAEEHPSDANYLAFAGGSAFGVPLDDPEEEKPLYTISARNIGDEINAAHETWKAYTQSADGPCDDTVHGYYWNDDQPMLYFKDVRDRPAYCAAHVVPLEELSQDLQTTATTPNFAWVAPNDCTDMEGCGADSVTPIDTETGCPGRALPAGYAPDAIAATSGGVYAVDGNSDQLTRLGRGQATRVGNSPAAIAVSGATAYVVNTIDGTVTPVDTSTGRAAGPLNVGAYTYPTVITITGQTAVIVEPYGYTVELINLKTRHVFPSITVGAFPTAVAITA
jgi:Phosphoesterase family